MRQNLPSWGSKEGHFEAKLVPRSIYGTDSRFPVQITANLPPPWAMMVPLWEQFLHRGESKGVQFQDKLMIFCGGILSYNFIAALSKLQKKCHYRSKLRTVLKRIFARKWYRSSAFTNSRQSGENLINFVNQRSLSPRKAVSATVDYPEHVAINFLMYPRTVLYHTLGFGMICGQGFGLEFFSCVHEVAS